MIDLTWHRDSHGGYSTETVGACEFAALIQRSGSGWYLTTTTFGLALTGKPYRTLALAKAEAQVTFNTVEVGASS